MHKKEQKRSTTIFSSMLRIMSLVLLLQISVVAFFVFKENGIVDQLRQNAGNIMHETISRRKGVLEHEMQLWKQDVQQLSYEVNEIIQERVVQLNASGESYSSTEERNKKVLSRQVLKELTTQVSNGMYNDRVSGMFIILGTSDSLEKEDQDQTLAGISGGNFYCSFSRRRVAAGVRTGNYHGRHTFGKIRKLEGKVDIACRRG